MASDSESLREQGSGNILATYEFSHEYYSYDVLDRLNLTDRRLRWSQSGTIERMGDTFGYNDAAELTAAGYGLIPNTQGQFVNPVRTMNYFPDNAGNRLHVDANGTLLATYSPNVLNQYAETSNGSEHEIAAHNNVTYRYLGDTRLARVSSSTAGSYELGYDALGRCVRRSSNGVSTYYIYDGERPIIEYDGGGTITARNTYGIGIDEILARDTGGIFYHQDRLGNVSAVTDALGQVVEQYRYDAFGQPEIRSAPVSGNPNGSVLTGTLVNNRFLFTGRKWAARYGFYEYRNRAYHPGLGRFMSEDPKGFKAGDRNLFRYCGGDPVNKTDPMGLLAMNSPDFRWSRLMWEQGNSPYGFSELYQKHVDAAAGRDRDFGSFAAAANSETRNAYNTMRKVSTPTEAGADIYQRDDNSDNYRIEKPRLGGMHHDINDEGEKGKYLGHEVRPDQHPRGYHVAGWLYAHPFYRPKVPAADQRRAYKYGWSAVLVTPARSDSISKNSLNVQRYNFPDRPDDD